MTKANTTSLRDDSTIKQHRRLKVKRGWYNYQGRQPLKQQSTIAEISLKGKGLADAGFAYMDVGKGREQERKLYR